eukprot:GHRQ01027435.1.p2 GENE.GHRQ01027435.1~~GHRQ01027435.1.p2  ORF type:complete len:100 (+),score=4.51 GHRQ01027435.1:125-424(+)
MPYCPGGSPHASRLPSRRSSAVNREIEAMQYSWSTACSGVSDTSAPAACCWFLPSFQPARCCELVWIHSTAPQAAHTTVRSADAAYRACKSALDAPPAP